MIELIKVFLCTKKNLINSERDLITTQVIGLLPNFPRLTWEIQHWRKWKVAEIIWEVKVAECQTSLALVDENVSFPRISLEKDVSEGLSIWFQKKDVIVNAAQIDDEFTDRRL